MAIFKIVSCHGNSLQHTRIDEKEKSCTCLCAHVTTLHPISLSGEHNAAWTFFTQGKAFLRAYYVDTKEHGNARPSICRSQGQQDSVNNPLLRFRIFISEPSIIFKE